MFSKVIFVEYYSSVGGGSRRSDRAFYFLAQKPHLLSRLWKLEDRAGDRRARQDQE